MILSRYRSMAFPPSGRALGVLLAIYILAGLTGHDPWKSDDAITIGIVHDMLSEAHWLTPHLAGSPYPDAPLYYWIAALTAKLFSWLLPLHDAARLASAAFTLLALTFILLTARELHGRENAAAAPLILAGSIGFLFHAHEAQPMLAALTAHTAAYWGLALMLRRPTPGAAIFGLALAPGFLANGLAAMLPLLLAAACLPACASDRLRLAGRLLAATVFAMLLSGLWLLPLLFVAPDFFAAFWQSEWAQLGKPEKPLINALRYLNMLPWYAWPALPLAGWTLWIKRRNLRSTALTLPLLWFASVWLTLGIGLEARSTTALLLLPPLVLLAVPAIGTLRRGAANAFDWFGMVTFTLFAAIAWIGWCAMVFGWPPRLARQVVRLEPGFVGRFDALACAIALAATLAWLWLIARSPRSPMRAITHWMAGLSLFWLLIVTLWMPWIDYGKTYRPLSAALLAALPEQPGCIANANLPNSILASLDYFDGIRTTPASSPAGRQCTWLLVQVSTRSSDTPNPGAGWKKVWENARPSDRRDRFRLYRRDPLAKADSPLFPAPQ